MVNLIPPFIARAWSEHRTEGSFDAFGLFLDISGFTQMTDTLMVQGKAGAEALSKIINAVFEPVLNELHARGGFVATFAGDAFTALFPFDAEEEIGEKVVATAIGMMSVFMASPLQKTPWGDFLLEAKIGLSRGAAHWGILSDGGHSGYYFRGPVVDLAASAEHHCRPRAIAMAADLSLLVPRSTRPDPDSPEGFVVFQPLPGQLQSTGLPISSQDTPGLASLERFVPLDQLPREGGGEFRTICSAFVSFDEKTQPLAEVYSCLARASEENGGYFNLLDFGDKGGSALFLFGAPSATEGFVGRALDFALAVRVQMPSVRIGLCSGEGFTGYLGSEQRRTYTALGSVVNLSARLALSAAPGQILTPSQGGFAELSQFLWTELDERLFKGFARPIPIRGLDGKKNAGRHYDLRPGVGREAEKSLLSAWIRRLVEEGRQAPLTVYGEAGLGKSQLAADVLRNLPRPWSYRILPCDPVFSKSFHLFGGLIREALGLAATATNEAELTARFQSFRAGLVSPDTPPELIQEIDRAAPALFLVTGLSYQDPSFAALDPQERHERILEALVAFFVLVLRREPTLFVVEQAQAIDDGSREVWERLRSRENSGVWGLLFLIRGDRPEGVSTTNETGILLKPFRDEEITSLVQRDYEGVPDKNFLDFLKRRTNSIPLYANELLRYLEAKGWLQTKNGFVMMDEVPQSALPKSLEDLLLSQVDALPAGFKAALPQLAVLGSRFPRSVADRLFPDQVPSLWSVGTSRGILRQDEVGYISFEKDFLREVVYQLQLGDRLKELHARAAEAWEFQVPDRNEASPEKAYHFFHAGKEDEARDYYRLAADQARDDYQNSEALLYYDQFLKLTKDDREKCKVRLDRAKILELTGEWDAALAELERGLGLAAISGKEESYHEFFVLLGQIRFKLGDSAAAKGYLEKAIRDPGTREVDPTLVQARIDLARIHILSSQYGEAMNRLLEAKDLAVEEKFELEEGLARYYLGVVLRIRNRKEEAMAAYRQSLELFRKLNRARYIANPLYDMSLIFQSEGLLDKAFSHMDEALTLYSQIGYKSGLGAAVLNLGAIEDQRGEFDKAREYFLRSRRITEELGEDLGVAYALFCLGASAYKQGELSQALSYLHDAHFLIESLQAESYKGYTLSYLVSVLVRMGRGDEAVGWAVKLEKVIRTTGEDVEKGRLYFALAELLEHRLSLEPDNRGLLAEIFSAAGIDRPTPARLYLKAIETARAVHYVNTLIPALYHLGVYLYRLERREAGARSIRKAWEESKRSGWTHYTNRIAAEYPDVVGE